MSEPVINISSATGLVPAEVQSNNTTGALTADSSQFALLLSKYIGAGTLVLADTGDPASVGDTGQQGLEQAEGHQVVLAGASKPIAEDFPSIGSESGLDDEVISQVISTGPQLVPPTAVPKAAVPKAAVPTTAQDDVNMSGLSSWHNFVPVSGQSAFNTSTEVIPKAMTGLNIVKSDGQVYQPADAGMQLPQSGNAFPGAESIDVSQILSTQGEQRAGGDLSQPLLINSKIEIIPSESPQLIGKFVDRMVIEAKQLEAGTQTAVQKDILPANSTSNNINPNVYSASNGQNNLTSVRMYSNVSQTGPPSPNGVFKLADNLVDQVVQRLSLVKLNERSEIRVKLHPEVLGDLNVKVSFENGVLNAKILTASYVVKESLESGLSQLRQTLNAQGFDVQSLSVGINDGKSDSHGNPGYRQGRFSEEQSNALAVIQNTEENDSPELEYAVNWLV